MNVKIPAQAELGRAASVVRHDLALARHGRDDVVMGVLSGDPDEDVPPRNKDRRRLGYVGRQQEVPPTVRSKMEWARQAPARNAGMVLTLGVHYSARGELVDAVRSIVD